MHVYHASGVVTEGWPGAGDVYLGTTLCTHAHSFRCPSSVRLWYSVRLVNTLAVSCERTNERTGWHACMRTLRSRYLDYSDCSPKLEAADTLCNGRGSSSRHSNAGGGGGGGGGNSNSSSSLYLELTRYFADIFAST